jgi:hypothetical protein
MIEITDVKAGKITRPQKAWRERLLCAKCEAVISRYERHARRLFVDPLPPHQPGASKARIHGRVEYARLKLFLLSIPWRSSVSSHPVFKHVSLGPHEEVIRQMLLDGRPGEATEYPILVWALHFQREPLRDLMVDPTYMRVEHLKCYRLVITGFVVLIFVSQQTPSQKFMRLMLAPGKPVITYDSELSDHRFLREVWNRAAESTKDVQI